MAIEASSLGVISPSCSLAGQDSLVAEESHIFSVGDLRDLNLA